MADVCISYDEDSAEGVARQIAEALEKNGISCWYAGRDMKRKLLRGEITKAIRDCRVFLLILSEKALKSAYVKAEIALAVQGFGDNRKRTLVAFRVDDSSVDAQLDAFLDKLRARDDFPSDIASFRIVDGCPIDIDKISRLKTSLKQMLNSKINIILLNPLQVDSAVFKIESGVFHTCGECSYLQIMGNKCYCGQFSKYVSADIAACSSFRRR